MQFVWKIGLLCFFIMNSNYSNNLKIKIKCNYKYNIKLYL